MKKICLRCEEEKDLELFSRDRTKRDGRQSWCKACKKVYMQSPGGKKSAQKYQQSEKGKEAAKRFVQSPKGKEGRKRQRQSEVGIATKKKYRQLPHAKDADRRRTSEYRARNPKKYDAHRAIKSAIQTGRLAPMPCEVCGSENVDAHHDNYDKPLDVHWFCRQHHSDHHRKQELSSGEA